MSVAYTVLERGAFVYARAEGALKTSDLIEHERALLADTRIRCQFRHLLDVRCVKGPDIDRGRLLRGHRCLDDAAHKLSGSRFAVVAHDAWWFDVRFQQEFEKRGLTLIAFNDPMTACLWLGVDYEQVPTENGVTPRDRDRNPFQDFDGIQGDVP